MYSRVGSLPPDDLESRGGLKCFGHRQIPISRSFICLLLTWVLGAFFCHFTELQGFFVVFILSGWLISLILHEFGHAIVAFYGGDVSVEEKGYLRLDILRYTDPVMTLVLPTIILLFGGIPLPGASVSVVPSHLYNVWWKCFTCFAGPLANFFCALLFSFLYWMYSLCVSPEILSSGLLGPGLAVLTFHQLMAVILNLLPLPPLDGWGILASLIPDTCFLKRWMSNPWHAKSISLITFLIIFIGVGYFPLFSLIIFEGVNLLGMPIEQLQHGLSLITAPFVF